MYRKKLSRSKMLRLMFFVVAISMLSAMSVFAADPVVAETVIGDMVTQIATTLMSVVGVVVGGIAGFFALKLAIVKGMSFVKVMVGKG